MRQIFTFLVFILFTGGVMGQVAVEGTPPTERYSLSESVEQYIMPSFDLQRLLEEDRLESIKGGVPPRFGHKMEVLISPKEYGSWEELPDGGRVWRLQITSFGAKSLNFIFSDFYLPQGAELYLYNQDKSYLIGAFTSINNKHDRVFATAPVKGESVTFEYYEPAHARNGGSIIISHVIHAYKNLFSTPIEDLEKGFGDSGACNNDVACAVSAGWEDQIRSVAMIVVGGSRSCTGAMVNNTAQDGTPYFLSANHCGTGVNNSWVFVFNYDSPTCGGSDGSLAHSITGGTLRSNYAPSDFSLTELSMPPPDDYVVFYSGWDHSGNPAPSSTAIHHPSGDVKKISFNNDALYPGNWPGSANVPGGNHWIVGQWEDGTTEGGSSGSPMYDHNQRVVGQLHGGSASCGSVTYDSYGMFSTSWTGGGSSPSRLSNWLDPSGTGVDTLDGAYFIDPPLAINMQNDGISGINDTNCDTDVTPVITVKNVGATDITAFDIEYSYDGGSVSTYNWTGPAIGFFQSIMVTLPTQTLSLGAHNFDAIVTNPNGMTDLDTNNDDASASFDVIDGNTLSIDLLTDNFPAETTYEIFDDLGNSLYFQGGFGDQATQYLNDFCLDDGCYEFVIYDSYADGICCGQFGDGAYTILDGNGTVIFSGGDFGASESTIFCLPVSDLIASFSVEDTYCVGDLIAPIESSANATGWSWSTPGADVESHMGQTPTFTYNLSGDYIITLTVTDDIGGSTSFNQQITVAEESTAPAQMAGPTVSTNGAQDTYAVPPTGGSSYNWTVTGGSQVSGGNNNIAAVLWDDSSPVGTVCVTRVNSDGCESEPLCTTVELQPLSIDNLIETTGLAIYPNPTSSEVNIDMRKTPDRIEIYDLIGQKVYDLNSPDRQNLIKLPEINGVYFIKITIDDVTIARRVLVRK